ncbi:hypothetical protein GCM10020220_064790 [Nonomuraea rubra]
MSDSMWPVLSDAERDQWDAVPLVGVGPLLFGMTRGQVDAALDYLPTVSGGDFASYSSPQIWGDRLTAYFRPATEDDTPPDAPGRAVPGQIDDGHEYWPGQRFGGVLAAVAIDARVGPQVRWDGLALTGQVPSVTDDALYARVKERGLDQEIRISQAGDYSYVDVGILLRVQRAGDILLTRPVFAAPAWTDRLGDTSEGPLPPQEWHTHA